MLAGAGVLVGAAAVAVKVNDDAGHAAAAAQRSWRVVKTLVLNIKEWVV